MGGQAADGQVAHIWYTRPVLFVADIGRSVRFYTEALGFRKAWHEADGKGTVCQVDRGGCEIILCEDSDRRDNARLFVSLTDVPEPQEAWTQGPAIWVKRDGRWQTVASQATRRSRVP